MRLIRFVCIFLLISSHAFSQDALSTNESSGIQISARFAAQEVPLNRTLKFIIQVEWFGDLDRYEISEIETPTTHNFSIVSNSSADKREMVDGKLKAIKTFEFELQPEELGMGYVEGVIVKYIDTSTGDGKHLLTNRLEAKVIDRIPEPGERSGIIFITILAVLLLFIVFMVFRWLRKRHQQKRDVEPPPPPLEETYLDSLKSQVELHKPDFCINDGFAAVSRLLRQYLGEKYKFAATNALLDEIITTLSQNDGSDRLINITKEVLDICDVVKFSGSDGAKSDLERVFTLVESLWQDELLANRQVEKLE